MNDPDTAPEPDRLAGAPHPRETVRLYGQAQAEQDFLAAHASGRLHHGWLLTGPKGVGKATLAWRIAKFLLATPEGDDGLFGAPAPLPSLDVSADHPVVRRLMAGSEGNLFLLRRPYDEKTQKMRKDITVGEVRRLKSFLSLSAAEGGRRVVIVDAADELNTNAANALLKLLEEPPAKTTLLLITHQPAGLLPTIRSRCRELRCQGLSPTDMSLALQAAGVTETYDANAIATLTSGSVGEAFRLLASDGLSLYAELIDLFSSLPDFNRPKALELANGMVGKAAESRLDLALFLIDLFLARAARTGVTGPPDVEVVSNEAALLTRLAPDAHTARKWADLHHHLGAAARHGKAVNLDPAALVFDTVLKISKTAAG